jgi:hypothetical protein
MPTRPTLCSPFADGVEKGYTFEATGSYLRFFKEPSGVAPTGSARKAVRFCGAVPGTRGGD